MIAINYQKRNLAYKRNISQRKNYHIKYYHSWGSIHSTSFLYIWTRSFLSHSLIRGYMPLMLQFLIFPLYYVNFSLTGDLYIKTLSFLAILELQKAILSPRLLLSFVWSYEKTKRKDLDWRSKSSLRSKKLNEY